MGQEDRVQSDRLSYFSYTVNAAVLAIQVSKGQGVLARTGVGTFTVTYPLGKGVDQTITEIVFNSKEAAGGTFAVAVMGTASTDEVKQIIVMDAAGAAVDNIDGSISVFAVG